jgi:predicted hotdog family 3-hydroxylacyl-ACP dehydratase
MRIEGAALADLLPQRGSMRMLDAVEAWDAQRIVCVTMRHRDPANPLAEGGRLSPLAGIEFAAQAMAAHGALLAGSGAPATGWLARVRDCVVQCERMDIFEAPLVIEAERIAGSDAASSYRFTVRAGERVVLAGSALVALAAEQAR